ncbi:MAG: hypothetical protein KKC42_03095, partial [Candidatus Omnitrophica bacterium]|nr:hypothetical protein [Candidatus Omnitrophota bacterium]
VLLPQFLPLIKNRSIFSQDEASAHNRYHRPFEDLFEQSARPLGYLLPAFVHPVFGKFAGQFVSSPLYGVSYTEHVLYLGWIPIMLAFYAFRRRKEATDKNFYLNFFLLLTVAAWFISQPPWWKLGPIKIYMPSFFFYKLFSSFRAYCRFGIIVVFAVAALAGFGLKFILDKINSNQKRIALGVIVTSLVLFEFWSWPPFKVINIEQVPAVYYWLKQQPGDFVIAEYPLVAQHPSTRYLLYQTKHEKKMINGAVPGSNASRLARSIFKLSEPYTPGVLSYWDVKYVLVHHDDYFRTELVEDREELIKIPKNPGLKFVKRFPAESCPQDNIICMQRTDIIDVYKVIAKPKEPAI